MLASYSLIKKHLDLTKQQHESLTPERIAEVLTLAGLEVDKVEHTPLGFEGVVIGNVLSTQPHPQAERLRIATVSDGKETFQVVCGAPNCRQGLITAFAKIGASLTAQDGSSFKIKKSKLRGVDSEGMLCSGAELNLSSDGEGILELSPDLELGTALATLYGDTVFEISLTPNLGHCLSMRGIARELSSLLHLPLHRTHFAADETSSLRTQDKIKVTIEDVENCSTYACRYLENVTIGPSPTWLKEAIESCGCRSINNVVDVTNYIMLEYGQPLHAFDYDKLEGSEIIVKSFSEEISLLTLDHIQRITPAGSLLICDKNKPLAIAGIMGGAESAISETTTRVVLEAAHFDPRSIRKTMRGMHLRTDSSSRFEKGIDPEGVTFALDSAAALIQRICNAKVASEPLCEKTREFRPKKILCRPSKINSILGLDLSLGEIEQIFHRLHMKTKVLSGENTLELTIPSYRNDIKEEIDLVEEVARVYGYDHITVAAKPIHPSVLPHSPLYLAEKNVRTRLISLGLQEMLTCDLISPKDAELSLQADDQEKSLIHVMQPSSIDQSILRPTLLSGLLHTIQHNFAHQQFDISGFELGMIHFQQEGRFEEKKAIGIILTGHQAPHFWHQGAREFDVFDLKGIVENLLEAFYLKGAESKPSHLKALHPGRQTKLMLHGESLAYIGEVHPSLLSELDIKQKVFFAQIDLACLIKGSEQIQLMKPLPIYPCSERDWTMTCKATAPMELLLSFLKGLSSRLLKEVLLLDIYQSEKLGKDKKNVTVRFVYRDDQKTLSLEAVDKEHARLLAMSEQKLADHLVSSI